MNFVLCQYGRQKSRQFAENRIEAGIGSGGASSAIQPSDVKSYSLVGLNMGPINSLINSVLYYWYKQFV